MLENKIEELTKALNRVADALEGNGTVVSEPQATSAPVVVAQAEPTPAAQTAPAPQQQSQPAAQSDVPFSDASGLVQYTMAKYKELGAEKGAKIQEVMKGLGYENINDVKPEHFADYYRGVEAIQ